MARQEYDGAAASARLCVETFKRIQNWRLRLQPPPRGCVLKHFMTIKNINDLKQPPPRGCVLKQFAYDGLKTMRKQPPPRGCVLKLRWQICFFILLVQPPPRSCVLKLLVVEYLYWFCYAAASAQLCVETTSCWIPLLILLCSRLRAAVCWNINIDARGILSVWQPPPRGCVLKPRFKTRSHILLLQLPPSGCVLKHQRPIFSLRDCQRPPLRGCVLKL